MSTIRCNTTLYSIGTWTIAHLPKNASNQLASRGVVMVRGTINGTAFRIPLEPDGKGSHWFAVDSTLRKAAGVQSGDTIKLEIEPSKDWVEPEVPADLQKALAASPAQVQTLWNSITPMARWDWIRWIRSTKQAETRARRIEVACSKLKAGMRRPCCFNRNVCTEPAVSHNWMLLEPATAA